VVAPNVRRDGVALHLNQIDEAVDAGPAAYLRRNSALVQLP